jgi:hypothetical protein
MTTGGLRFSPKIEVFPLDSPFLLGYFNVEILERRDD